MNADYLFSEVTESVIAAAFEVHRTLGAGFLESVYCKALHIELSARNLDFRSEWPIQVRYRNELVGEFRADLLVANEVIVEVKALSNVQQIHEVQLVNYLNATGKSVGLLLNFGASVQVRRKVQTKNLRSSAKSA